MSGKKEFGDYQTPQDFALSVCKYLLETKKISPDYVVEPTCGIGNFLESSLVFNAKAYWGIEINPKYATYCRNRITDNRVTVINGDFFTCNLKKVLPSLKNVLIIGNPPWVTNSELSALGSENLPTKANFKGLKGLDAITGASNFDICEYMLLQIINVFQYTNATIAMLCKTSVARNVFKELKRKDIYFKSFELLEFNAGKVFNVNTSACVLLIQMSDTVATSDTCNVFSFENPATPTYSFGFVKGQFYSNIAYTSYNFDGQCCFEWRQGVKHDCSKIMELVQKNGVYINGNKETLNIEDTLVFPLIKSSMFKSPIIHSFKKYVIVTQKKTKDDTSYISSIAPKTWDYLIDNIESFRNRKSSIYRNAPDFSMFGVGDYSYSKYKVGVSGFYKKPIFSVLYSNDNRPVMTDDTSYFICFETYDMAYVAMLLLNSKPVQEFLMSIAFLDAKRPYTKKVLKRISFEKIVASISFETLIATESDLKLDVHITEEMYNNFKNLPQMTKEK